MTDTSIIKQKVGQLFKKYGIKSITMDDISSKLGMSKKTLYQIVSDKTELIDMVLDEDFFYYKKQLESITRENYDAVLELIKINSLLHKFLSELSLSVNYDLQKYHADIYDRIKENYVTLFLDIIKSNLLKGKEQRVFRSELNENMISKLLLSRIEQVPNSQIFKPDEFTSPAFVKEICRYHLHGVVNSEGHKLVEKYKHEIENINKQEAI
jgi:AcrR family transcriptional regulator